MHNVPVSAACDDNAPWNQPEDRSGDAMCVSCFDWHMASDLTKWAGELLCDRCIPKCSCGQDAQPGKEDCTVCEEMYAD